MVWNQGLGTGLVKSYQEARIECYCPFRVREVCPLCQYTMITYAESITLLHSGKRSRLNSQTGHRISGKFDVKFTLYAVSYCGAVKLELMFVQAVSSLRETGVKFDVNFAPWLYYLLEHTMNLTINFLNHWLVAKTHRLKIRLKFTCSYHIIDFID